jgi:hypothetical protein
MPSQPPLANVPWLETKTRGMCKRRRVSTKDEANTQEAAKQSAYMG